MPSAVFGAGQVATILSSKARETITRACILTESVVATVAGTQLFVTSICTPTFRAMANTCFVAESMARAVVWARSLGAVLILPSPVADTYPLDAQAVV